MRYKKTKIAIILTVLFGSACSLVLLNVRKIPPSIMNDPVRRRRFAFISTPYDDGTEVTFIMEGSTIGQLTKTSSKIFMGTVVNSRVVGEDTAEIRKCPFALDYARAGLLFEIEVFPGRVIGGEILGNSAKIFLSVYFDILNVPKKGDEVILYVKDYHYDIKYYNKVRSYNEKVWGYNLEDLRRWRKKLGYNSVNSVDRGVINLEDENRDNLVQIAEGYFRHLRSPDRNRMDYFWFLQDLTTNASGRVRLDSRTDAIYLLQSCTLEELRTIVSSEYADPQFREFAEDIIKTNQQILE